MLERRRWQHDANKVVAWRDPAREAPYGPPSQEHDRPLRAGEQPGLLTIDAGEELRLLEVGHHHCQGLARPVLAAAKLAHGRVARGITGQMKAAEIPDGQDAAGGEELAGGSNCLASEWQSGWSARHRLSR